MAFLFLGRRYFAGRDERFGRPERSRGGDRGGRDGRASADEALIRALYTEHGRALLAYATRLTGDRAVAEDVVQETLVRAWKHPDVLVNGKGSVRGWLLTVARNLVTDRVRARAARPAEVPEIPEKPPIQSDHAEDVVNSMTVLAALDELSVEHRTVLHEIYFGGLSVSEAAQKLGLPPGTVKSRSYYALRALREAFGREPFALKGAAG